MRATFLMVLLLLLGTQAADARHYHFHYRHWGHSRRYNDLPGALAAPDLGQNQLSFRHRSGAQVIVLGRPFPPPDWQLQPVDPQHKGRRYQSPDGAASLVFYASPTGHESASEHLKSVAFVDGEKVLTLAGTQSELLVTGTRNERMFVRKTRLACSGHEWHHVMLEFPTNAQRDYARISEQAVRALDLADDDGCAPIATNEPAASDATTQGAGQTPPPTAEAPSVTAASPPGTQSSEPNSH